MSYARAMALLNEIAREELGQAPARRRRRPGLSRARIVTARALEIYREGRCSTLAEAERLAKEELSAKKGGKQKTNANN